MKIIITRRTNDYHACLEGHPEIWAAGKTIYEAVGDLILHHGEKFNIQVEGPAAQ
jgi:hypothetical protein